MSGASDRRADWNAPFPTVSYAQWLERVALESGESPSGAVEALSTRVDGLELEPLYTARHPQPLVPVARGRAEGAGWLILQSTGTTDDLDRVVATVSDDLTHGVEGVRLTLDRVSDLRRVLRHVPSSWRIWLSSQRAEWLAGAAVWIEALTGLDLDQRILLMGVDPIGAIAASGTLRGEPETAEGDLAQLVRFCRRWGDNVRALQVSTVGYREAGAELDQEIGIALATGVHYLRSLERQGLTPAQAAAQIGFETAIGQSVFPELAKLRALRELWRRVLETCDVDAIGSWIHSTVLRRSLDPHDEWTNLLRITAAAWAAILGGTDSLETPAFDDLSAVDGSGRGTRLARNIQHILREEAHLARVEDPAAGSYALERITANLIDAGWQRFLEIESQGGILTAVTSSWLQARISERWVERRRAIAGGKIEFVRPTSPGEPPDATRPSRQAARPMRGASEATAGDPGERLQGAMTLAADDRSVAEIDRWLYPGDLPSVCDPLPRHSDFEVGQDA